MEAEPQEKFELKPDDNAERKVYAKTGTPKAGNATPKLVISLSLYRKLRKIKRELSDSTLKPTAPIAEWNYRKGVQRF